MTYAVLSGKVVGQIRLEHLLVGWPSSASRPAAASGEPVPGPPPHRARRCRLLRCGSGDTRAPVAVCSSTHPPAGRWRNADPGGRWSRSWIRASAPIRGWTCPDRYGAQAGRLCRGRRKHADHHLPRRTESAASARRPATPLIKDPWDRPVTGDPLVGELDEATRPWLVHCRDRASGRPRCTGPGHPGDAQRRLVYEDSHQRSHPDC